MAEKMSASASGMAKGQGLKGFATGTGRNVLLSGCSRMLQRVSMYQRVTARQTAFRMKKTAAPVS